MAICVFSDCREPRDAWVCWPWLVGDRSPVCRKHANEIKAMMPTVTINWNWEDDDGKRA